MTEITPEIVREHGLSDSEYANIKRLLNRDPNYVELGVFSVMWSEHCSYKSTRAHLRRLHTSGPQVIQGPGENAGVVDIGDGDVAVFKMESHNHPSFIEPYQGAATGVGGIMRDVFTMGARPVVMMNALRFGAPDHPKTRHLVSGVVAGIGGYGNCMGVPTVGGEVNFHSAYNGNILVNAMCVGLARQDKIFKSAAKGAGNAVVYIGSKTGRDGIHGATMASAEFDEDSDEKRPTVQVGDPFTEKLLLEACLELMATDAIIAIQDMGAAGPFALRLIPIPIHSIVPKMHTRQHNFPIAVFLQTSDVIQNGLQRAAVHLRPHLGNDAVAAAQQTAVLYFDVGTMSIAETRNSGGDIDDSEAT